MKRRHAQIVFRKRHASNCWNEAKLRPVGEISAAKRFYRKLASLGPMRITLTTLTIAFAYALWGTIVSLTHWTFGDFLFSLIMSFSFIIIPLFMCVCVFHFVLWIYRQAKRQPVLMNQILILCCIYNLFLFLLNLPDLLRHQNDPAYVPYKSFSEYFSMNMLEDMVTATIFAITIPAVDRFIKAWIERSGLRGTGGPNGPG